MDKKKKIIVMISIFILIILIIGGITWYISSKQSTQQENGSKLNLLYEDLASKETYSFSISLDDNNQMRYAKSSDKAYVDTIYNGIESKFIIRDGNSYLLIENSKVYYTYENNETDLNKIEVDFENFKDAEFEKGKEKIEGTTYKYEEYKILTNLTMQDTSDLTSSEEVKTRFYFKDDQLVYIKTKIGEKQELLKVDISYNVDNNLFEIPSDYKEM